jgi:adenine phosphoribosyltransferase
LQLETYIRDIPDFPKPGIVFKDITPLSADAGALAAAVEQVGGEVVGCSFLIELAFLGGRSKLADQKIQSLITYEEE